MDKLAIHGMDVVTMTEIVRKLSNIGGIKIGGDFLPFKEVPTEQTMWDVVRAASPMAEFRAIDGEAKLSGKKAFDRAYADLVDIAVKHRFNASDVRKINEGESIAIADPEGGNRTLAYKMAQEAKDKVRGQLEDLRNRVDNRVEWMRINALRGEINYAGEIVFNVDYGIPGDQKGLVPSALWSSYNTSTPLADIQEWQQIVGEATGIFPDTLIISRKALFHASQSESINNVLKYTTPVLSIKAAKEYLEDNAEITIVMYDTRYSDENGSASYRFLPENAFIMVPSKSQLPEGVGDTATTGHPLADFEPGYYTWQDTKKDPYGLEVGVGLSAFPRIIHPEAIATGTLF